MMYPLVRELAGDGVPVTVTCRVLKIARQPYYRWLKNPITTAERDEAYRANALFDAHRDDPEFGYRFLLEEARAAGEAMTPRTAWKICSSNLSLVFRLVREWYVRDGLEDDLAVGVDRGWEGLGRAVDRDGRGAQGA